VTPCRWGGWLPTLWQILSLPFSRYSCPRRERSACGECDFDTIVRNVGNKTIQCHNSEDFSRGNPDVGNWSIRPTRCHYFIVLLIGSTCFGHYYAHHQELATVMLVITLVVSFCKDGGVSVNTQPPHTTWKDQLCFSLQPGHYSSLTAPNLQHTANHGMYNFRFTVLMNTNNTSNYQSTNKTHHTQQNTTITTHKGSQLLILTKIMLPAATKRQRTSHRT